MVSLYKSNIKRSMSETVAKTVESQIGQYVSDYWDQNAIPSLSKFIEIPNVSPLYDKEWETNGLLDQAADHLISWIHDQKMDGLHIDKIQHTDLSPLVLVEIDATSENSNTILMYGHMDKQPPLTKEWKEGLHPYKPVVENGKLYGRGGCDDGYALYAAIGAVKALKEHSIPHSRIVILIEASEESGSAHLPQYFKNFKKMGIMDSMLGKPELIVCLDSGADTYDRLWITSSLRGCIVGELKVEVLTESRHSGDSGGIVPSSFMIARQLLDRVENSTTGKIANQFQVVIPASKLVQIKSTADVVGEHLWSNYPYVGNCRPLSLDPQQLIINKAFSPQLEVIGADGFPTLEEAGNMLRPYTTLMLSMRLPPTVPADEAAETLKQILEAEPPYGASVSFTYHKGATGWECNQYSNWLQKSTDEASLKIFGKTPCRVFEGGSIPFMGMLGNMFPDAEFVVTGIVGPDSNIHGPNESMDIPYVKKLTTAMSFVLRDFCANK